LGNADADRGTGGTTGTIIKCTEVVFEGMDPCYPACLEFGLTADDGIPYAMLTANRRYDRANLYKRFVALVRGCGMSGYRLREDGGRFMSSSPCFMIGTHGGPNKFAGLGKPYQVGRQCRVILDEMCETFEIDRNSIKTGIDSCYAAENARSFARGLGSSPDNLPYVPGNKGLVSTNNSYLTQYCACEDWLDNVPNSPLLPSDPHLGIPTPDCGETPNLSLTPTRPNTPPRLDAPRSRRALGRFGSMIKSKSKTKMGKAAAVGCLLVPVAAYCGCDTEDETTIEVIEACGAILNAIGGGPNKYELEIEESMRINGGCSPGIQAIIRHSHRCRL
jgi:hypothetical protein